MKRGQLSKKEKEVIQNELAHLNGNALERMLPAVADQLNRSQKQVRAFYDTLSKTETAKPKVETGKGYVVMKKGKFAQIEEGSQILHVNQGEPTDRIKNCTTKCVN